jgi:RNA polymerase sigma factor (sigma-70 family)
MSPAGAGLEQIYAASRADLLRFLVARTGNVPEAEDVMQELWLRLGAAPTGPIANGRAYLFRMAQNLVLDRLREHKRRLARDGAWVQSEVGTGAGGEDLADPDANAETAMILRDDADRLAQAISALPPAAREAFRLHKIDGLAHAEVARRLGISRSGVEKHIAVAMAHLRRALGD